MPKKLTDAEKAYLLDVVKSCKLEDDSTRKYQIAMWKRNEEFWNGIQYIYWNESVGDWEVPSNNGALSNINLGEETRDQTQPFYDYVINIYKAHGEGIISALSQRIPSAEFFPIDADDDADLTAARTKTRLASTLQ